MSELVVNVARRRLGRGAGLARVRLWLELWSERRALGRLDWRMLSDIGVSAGDAALEAARPPWNVPEARRHA